MTAEFLYIGLYEVREIPKGWQHPIDEHGMPVPLFRAGAWREMMDEDAPITADNCLPETNGEAELVVYETCTEGTPVTPAFPKSPEGRLAMLSYCAEHVTTLERHKTGIEGWAAILFGDAAVAGDGTVRTS
ncbi:MAG: hypothetical protein M3P30_03065 [Chloroflexota bacterium]|nr:hypothetical protein [Chloroflexota bacterium]